ncbi:MAG: alginate export family protein [Blastocatellia bacterium]|nr:alginate export family protein [Blastocatellia bacterium]
MSDDLKRVIARTSRIVFLLLLTGLFFAHSNQASAQEMSGQEKDEILKRLSQLEKEIESLKKENADLKAMVTAKENSPDVKQPPQASGGETTVVKKEPAEAKNGRLEIGGQIRFRPEVRNNADLNSSISDLDDFTGQRIRLHIKAALSDNVYGFIQFQDSRFWGTEASTASNEGNTDLHQAYIEVNGFLADPLSLKLGRQEMIYGNERLVGAFGWDTVGRSFDALKLVYGEKGWSADLFAAKVNDRRTARRGDGDQDFYGAYLKFLKDKPAYELETYSLYIRDGFDTPGELFGRGLDSTSIFTFGARHAASFPGGFYYDGELALQSGSKGPDDHRALALALKAGRAFDSDMSPRLGFEYDFATGDKDPLDGKSGEFVNLFPTNHIQYGYMDYLGWRNMYDLRATFSFKPTSNLVFDTDYHRFYLHRAKGRWTNAGGAVFGFDPSGRSGTYLGQEVDFTLRFPYKEKIKFLGGYSFFLPGSFARATRGRDVSHFSYLQTLIDF